MEPFRQREENLGKRNASHVAPLAIPPSEQDGLGRLYKKPRAGFLAERVGELQSGQSCPGMGKTQSEGCRLR